MIFDSEAIEIASIVRARFRCIPMLAEVRTTDAFRRNSAIRLCESKRQRLTLAARDLRSAGIRFRDCRGVGWQPSRNLLKSIASISVAFAIGHRLDGRTQAA